METYESVRVDSPARPPFLLVGTAARPGARAAADDCLLTYRAASKFLRAAPRHKNFLNCLQISSGSEAEHRFLRCGDGVTVSTGVEFF